MRRVDGHGAGAFFDIGAAGARRRETVDATTEAAKWMADVLASRSMRRDVALQEARKRSAASEAVPHESSCRRRRA